MMGRTVNEPEILWEKEVLLSGEIILLLPWKA